VLDERDAAHDGTDQLGRVEMYAPAFAQAGSSASHWSDDVEPIELMMPFFEAPLHDVGLAAPALADMGWQLAATRLQRRLRRRRLGDDQRGDHRGAHRPRRGGGAICAAADANSEGVVTISELIASVARALDGCPTG
jgi:hypothetical protein